MASHSASHPAVEGTSLDRVEGADKVTGHACYTADRVLPDLAHAVVVQSPIAHGR